MKKFLITLLVFGFTIGMANATNVIVESLEAMDSNKENSEFSAKVLEDAELKSGQVFKTGAVLKGIVVKKVDAKRGKRGGYIVIQPVTLEYNGVVENFEGQDIEATVQGYSKKSWKELGSKAGLSVGLAAAGKCIPGVSQMFYFSKGLIQPEEDKSRLESAVNSVYKNSPFVYIEKGQDINIEQGDMLVLKFYNSDVPKWRVLKRSN